MKKAEEDSKKLLMAALAANLKLSYEQRIEAHEGARALMLDLAEAGKTHRAKSKSAS